MYAIVIHGGAGVINQSEADESGYLYIDGLKMAMERGFFILKNGGSAIDAVESAVIELEDNVLFNAGKGSAFTADFSHEMEASIMNGQNLNAGAVGGLRNVRNPIVLARKVLEKSEHLFLSGKGAEKFAQENNLVFEPDNYFFTAEKYKLLQNTRFQKARNMGTVGAVALDSKGNLAAATSTGGLTNKNYGRIGDSPIIGAGTYANNASCAVSCTGDGEYFIRAVAAYDVACLVSYRGLPLQAACDEVIMNKMKALGGEGGLIAIDKAGNISVSFNSNGMYRAFRKEGGDPFIGIF